MAWPTEPKTSTETYESQYGNEATATTTVWPAAPIQIASEPPTPPGDQR
jgi:hypothetical protein